MSTDIRAALSGLINYVERNECRHEETHRGGAIWTVCDGCGRKWADDRGGFKPYQEPQELTAAIAALDSLVAEPTAEQNLGLAVAIVSELIAQRRATEDRLHADDARAFGAALLTVPREYSITSNIELAKKAHEIADAFKAERKRRQG